MIRIIIFLFLFAPVTAFSQNFIGKTRSHVKKELEKTIAKNDSLTITLSDNDSTLVFSYKEGKVQPVDFIYGFNKAGKCRSEKTIARCDSCFKKFLTAALGQKKYGWKKINENQYISKYSAQMMIELPANETDFSYSILHTEWTKELYESLKGN
ncbi:MAG TPA: hypothetical protein VGO58_05355 [Chitinophagaceae bacterium]|jgi:hypothetical protein|nr:hypothetical protein [Chitinophagaceae bacterium]